MDSLCTGWRAEKNDISGYHVVYCPSKDKCHRTRKVDHVELYPTIKMEYDFEKELCNNFQPNNKS